MGLTYVNVLTVTSTFLEGLSPNFANGRLCEPQFCLWHLKEFHMSIGISFINPSDIASFLENCPNLERIFIDLGESSFERGYLWEVQARERFEKCNPSFQSLKVVKVTGFKFQKLELELVMFFLKKAKTLESLALVSSRNNQPKVNSQDARFFYFQLIACRRSPNAKVEMFEYLDDKSSIHPRHPRVGRKFLRGRALDDWEISSLLLICRIKCIHELERS